MKVSAIIVAGGKGVRLSGEYFEEGSEAGQFKQFLPLLEKPVLAYSIIVFEKVPQVNEIIVVVPEEKIGYCKALVKKCGFKKVCGVIGGGKFRQDSVYNGLLKTGKEKPNIVLIHDGVRPLITPDLIQRCIEEVKKYKAVILAVPVTDTVKLAKKSFVEKTLERNRLWSVQTPQGFNYDLILKAHKKARSDKFLGSDDASLVERLGHPVRIAEGSNENIKITHFPDFILAKEILKRRGSV